MNLPSIKRSHTIFQGAGIRSTATQECLLNKNGCITSPRSGPKVGSFLSALKTLTFTRRSSICFSSYVCFFKGDGRYLVTVCLRVLNVTGMPQLCHLDLTLTDHIIPFPLCLKEKNLSVIYFNH